MENKNRHTQGHKTEIRKREIWDNYCIQPGCKFKGELAAQGVCHTILDKKQHDYITSIMKQAYNCLEEIKKLRKANKQLTAKAWIRTLEGYFICYWANQVFTLDELIYLRADNAKLRLAAGKWRKAPRRARKPRC
jgi:hypothetical protein